MFLACKCQSITMARSTNMYILTYTASYGISALKSDTNCHFISLNYFVSMNKTV
uniref:Uncharacterized protein n=1 Tax=Anguilla anguilla TaxID=7936 RepID=A0A0E9XUV0_ANGAN